MKKLFILMLALLILMPMVVGCAGLKKAIDEHELVTKLAVQAASGRVFEAHPGWVDKAYHITDEAIQLFSADGESNLAGLEQFIIERIPWQQMTPEEQALLTTLISAVRQEIESKLAARGVNDPGEVMVRAVKILGWIRDTAAIRKLSSGDSKGGVPALACSLCRPDHDGLLGRTLRPYPT